MSPAWMINGAMMPKVPMMDFCWVKNQLGEKEPYEVYLVRLATATGNGTTTTDSDEYKAWAETYKVPPVGYPWNETRDGYSRDELSKVLRQHGLYVQPETSGERRQRLQLEYAPAFEELDRASAGAARRRDAAVASGDFSGEQNAKDDLTAISKDYMGLLSKCNEAVLNYDTASVDGKPRMLKAAVGPQEVHVKWCPLCGARTEVITLEDDSASYDACTYSDCPYVHKITLD